MPELPEVETVRKGLENRLASFRIKRIEVCREKTIASSGGSSEFIKMMKGAEVGKWYRRGKYLIASLHGQKHIQTSTSTQTSQSHGWWCVHLRMTGHFQWHKLASPACPHTRIRFWNQKGEELRFVDTRSFGQMWWIAPDNLPEEIIKGLKTLGPEPFSSTFNASYLKERLKGKTRSIKSSLLDQTLVAGAGNIYADESLFSAGISPKRESGKLKEEELALICNSLVKVLKISIGKGGTTFSDFRDLEGLNGNYGGQAWVYRRVNQPCRVCGTKIKREKIAGRSSHWCPKCQPE